MERARGSSPSAPPRRGRGPGRAIAFWTGLLLLLEALVRVAAALDEGPAGLLLPPRPTPTVPDADLGYVLPAALDRSGGCGPETAALRILCIGNSNVWGHFIGVEGTFPYLLERRLAARGVAARVVNAGVPGYTAGQIRRALERRLATETYALVVFTAGWNDLHAAAAPPWARGLAAPGAPGPLDRLGLARLLDGVLERLVPLLLAPDRWDETRLDEAGAEVRRIASAARAAGARAYALELPCGLGADTGHAEAGSAERVVYPPVRPFTPAGYRRLFRALADRYRAAAAAEGVVLLSSGVEYEAPWAEKRLLLLDQCHPSPGGNRRVAASIEARMEADGLLTGSRSRP